MRVRVSVLGADVRLLSSCSVLTDDEIAALVATHASDDVVAAIDAPVIVANQTGARPCELEITRRFDAYNAGRTHRITRPYFDPPRAETLARHFGWDTAPVRPVPGRSSAIGRYPHPAMVSLLGLDRVLPYKDKGGRTVPSLRQAFEALLDNLERLCGLTLRLESSARRHEIREAITRAERKVDLGRVEDEVDAIFCAYLAWLCVAGPVRAGRRRVP